MPTRATFSAGLLDGTLLGDFWQHCVGDLIKALQNEISFISGDDLSTLEDDPDEPPVSMQRKKATSVLNLLIQLFNQANGAYVFLSRKEHVILRTLYTNLRELLRSKTFCGMFRGDEFPAYPFPTAPTPGSARTPTPASWLIPRGAASILGAAATRRSTSMTRRRACWSRW